MKQIYTMCILLLVFAMYGCGDKTTINGYSESEVSKLLADNKDTVYQVTDGDSVLTYIYVTDTLYNEIVDTVYNRVTDTLYKEMIDTVYNKVVDTLYNELIDTIYTRVVDTVVNTLVDTIVTRVIDTVINTMVDTVYTRVIDTVFATLNDIGIDTELPRDTSITLTAIVDGNEIKKQYFGVVYKHVFYDTTIYQYADTNHVWVHDKRGDITGYLGAASNAYIPVGTHYTQSDNCSGCNYILLAYDIPSQCGGLGSPNSGVFHEYVYRGSVGGASMTQKYQTVFTGWHMLNDDDAYSIQNVADLIIPPGATVFTSVISTKTSSVGATNSIVEYLANAITSNGIRTINKPMNYMCAYDLK